MRGRKEVSISKNDTLKRSQKKKLRRCCMRCIEIFYFLSIEKKKKEKKGRMRYDFIRIERKVRRGSMNGSGAPGARGVRLWQGCARISAPAAQLLRQSRSFCLPSMPRSSRVSLHSILINYYPLSRAFFWNHFRLFCDISIVWIRWCMT